MKSLSEERVKIKEYVHSSNMSREIFDCESDRLMKEQKSHREPRRNESLELKFLAYTIELFLMRLIKSSRVVGANGLIIAPSPGVHYNYMQSFKNAIV